MAVNSDAYVVPTIGRVYLAPVGTPAPDVGELGSPASPWEIVGHVGTADGDGLPTFVADGGDVTSLGSWNQRVVRSVRSEEHTSELQSRENLVCRLLLEKNKIRLHLMIILAGVISVRFGL